MLEATEELLDPPPKGLPELLIKCRRDLGYFWDTVARVRELLSAEGLDPVFIKTLRTYPYYDSNLDILVTEDEWASVERALLPAGFRRATWRRDWGKFLLEPDKDWYHAPAPYTPVHVYPKVSWHGMAFIPATEVLETAMERSFMGRTFLGPAWTQDVMIHCPHTVYENYTLKLGEFIHMVTVLKGRSVDPGRLWEVAQRFAWTGALDYVLGLVKGLHSQFMPWEPPLTFPIGQAKAPKGEEAPEFPIAYPRRALLPMWLQRSGYHLRHGRLNSAAKELWRHPAYKFYKRVLRRARAE